MLGRAMAVEDLFHVGGASRVLGLGLCFVFGEYHNRTVPPAVAQAQLRRDFALSARKILPLLRRRLRAARVPVVPGSAGDLAVLENQDVVALRAKPGGRPVRQTGGGRRPACRSHFHVRTNDLCGGVIALAQATGSWKRAPSDWAKRFRVAALVLS